MIDASRHEPPPVANDSPPIYQLVMADIETRALAGHVKYGMFLQPWNGRDALMDLYQELLDACCYIRQRMEEEK